LRRGFFETSTAAKNESPSTCTIARGYECDFPHVIRHVLNAYDGNSGTGREWRTGTLLARSGARMDCTRGARDTFLAGSVSFKSCKMAALSAPNCRLLIFPVRRT